jgi:hypothetical protein
MTRRRDRLPIIDVAFGHSGERVPRRFRTEESERVDIQGVGDAWTDEQTE